MRSLKKKNGRVFKNRGLRKIFQHKMEVIQKAGENYIISSIMICTPYQILLRYDRIMHNKTGRTRGMYGREKKCM
jgi:hypothetical protein